MTALLGTIALWCVKNLLPVLLGWLAKEAHIVWQDWRDKKADEAKNAEVRKQEETAQTPAEREDAAKKVADNLFK